MCTRVNHSTPYLGRRRSPSRTLRRRAGRCAPAPAETRASPPRPPRAPPGPEPPGSLADGPVLLLSPPRRAIPGSSRCPSPPPKPTCSRARPTGSARGAPARGGPAAPHRLPRRGHRRVEQRRHSNMETFDVHEPDQYPPPNGHPGVPATHGQVTYTGSYGVSSTAASPAGAGHVWMSKQQAPPPPPPQQPPPPPPQPASPQAPPAAAAGAAGRPPQPPPFAAGAPAAAAAAAAAAAGASRWARWAASRARAANAHQDGAAEPEPLQRAAAALAAADRLQPFTLPHYGPSYPPITRAVRLQRPPELGRLLQPRGRPGSGLYSTFSYMSPAQRPMYTPIADTSGCPPSRRPTARSTGNSCPHTAHCDPEKSAHGAGAHAAGRDDRRKNPRNKRADPLDIFFFPSLSRFLLFF